MLRWRTMPAWAYESIRLLGLQAYRIVSLKSAHADCPQYLQVIKWFEQDFFFKSDFIWSFDIYYFFILLCFFYNKWMCKKIYIYIYIIFVDSLNKALGLSAQILAASQMKHYALTAVYLYTHYALNQGRTGTKFQAVKSHTHPGHHIHPQQILKPPTTIFFVWPSSSSSHKSLNF